MHRAKIWTGLILARMSTLLLVSTDYLGPFSGQSYIQQQKLQNHQQARGDDENIKGTNDFVPSCTQLKALWRYSKRQGRAAEETNSVPVHRVHFDSLNPILAQPELSGKIY